MIFIEIINIETCILTNHKIIIGFGKMCYMKNSEQKKDVSTDSHGVSHQMQMDNKPNIYTCREYREEMILAGLKIRLTRSGLSENERSDIEQEIHRIEKILDF
jgi:hypothetical protein